MNVMQHQEISFFVWHKDGQKYAWVNEGIPEFLSITENSGKDISYEFFVQGVKMDDSDTRKFCELAKQYYLKRKDNPGSKEDLDQNLFYDAMAIVSFEHPFLKPIGRVLSQPITEVYSGDILYEEGNLLTYVQARYFIEFLVERYGYDTVIDFCLDGSELEPSFGCSYEELYEQLMQKMKTGIANE